MTGASESSRRRPVRLVASAVAVTLVVQIVGLAAWRSHQHWRMGHVVLTNDGPPLSVQVLHESDDDPIGEPVALIRRTTLDLPEGDYRLRVTGEGWLSRVYRFNVNRGESLTQSVTPDHGGMLQGDPVRSTSGTLAIELTPGRSDFVTFGSTTLGRRDGVSGKPIWEAIEPRTPGKPPRANHPWIDWFAKHSGGLRPIVPAPDLDGDGTRDLVWAAGAAMLAVSGKDGSILWTYLAELDGPGGAYPEGPELPGPIRPDTRPAEVVGVPAMADVDRDGTPDVLTAIVFREFPAEIVRRRPNIALPDAARFIEPSVVASPVRELRPAGWNPGPWQNVLGRRVVVAVSGRTGRRLWAYAIDPTFMTVAGYHPLDPPAIVRGRRTSMAAILAGSKWIGLDLATGRPGVGPIDLGSGLLLPPQYADLDGDGDPELLATGAGTVPTIGVGAGNLPMSAWSIATGRPLWTAAIDGPEHFFYEAGRSPEWPLVADLDGDGRAEVFVPDAGMLDATNYYRGVRLLDGPSGRPRWTRPMRPDNAANDGLVHIVEAPDLDRDGVRDVVTASVFLGRRPTNAIRPGPEEPARVYVDALSGKDGRPLWCWRADRPADGPTYVPPPRWWGRGPDGWPLLAVPIEVDARGVTSTVKAPSDPDPPTLTVLEASTGLAWQSAIGVTHTEAADLDGDGLVDLWGQHRGLLRTFRGEPPEAWRAFDLLHHVDREESDGRSIADLDGDGIGDALTLLRQAPGGSTDGLAATRTAVARSGRDGRLIWRTDLDLRRGWFERDRAEVYSLTTFPMPDGDLDGDGTPDVLVHEDTKQLPSTEMRRAATLPLLLLSGRTGGLLWMAGPLPTGFEAHGFSIVSSFEPRAIEPGSAPDLVVWHNSPFLSASATPPAWGSATQPRLARLSGRTGRVVWDIPLWDPQNSFGFGEIPPPGFEDLNGDGQLDALIASDAIQRDVDYAYELRAVALHDGRTIWSKPLAGVAPALTLAVADSDDPRRPVVVTLTWVLGPGDGHPAIVQAFDGRDGKSLWSWSPNVQEFRPDVGSMIAARLEGDGRRRLYIGGEFPGGKRGIVVLGGDGRELRRRDRPWSFDDFQRAARLGDVGLDRLLTEETDLLRAWGPGLEPVWSWRGSTSIVDSIVPAAGGRPPGLMLRSGLILDAGSGRPTWRFARESGATLLDPGDSARPPLLIENTGELTIVRAAIPATPDGKPAPTIGRAVPPGLVIDDPRWTRPLPWVDPIRSAIGPDRLAAFVALATVNVVGPLGLLWLAARRRPWTLRLLMALPLAAAVPLSVFQTVEPLVPAEIGGRPVSSKVVFALATIAGVPIVALAAAIVRDLFRRRWRSLTGIIGLTIAASALIAAAWIRVDSRTMPAIEQYGHSGWPLAVVPGAYAAGVLVILLAAIGRLARAAFGTGRRRTDLPC